MSDRKRTTNKKTEEEAKKNTVEKKSVTKPTKDEAAEAKNPKPKAKEPDEPQAKEVDAKPGIEIPIDKIGLGDHQPRNREALEKRGNLTRLKENIKEVGLLHPILVEPQKDGTYLLISGERRLRAHKLLNRKKIRAVFPSKKTQKVIQEKGRTLRELALFENVQRKDLTPIEEARCFEQLIEHLGCSQEELGERLGVTHAYVSQRISLLGLPEEVQDMIEDGDVNMSQARELVRLKKIQSKKKRKEAQIEIAKKIDVEKLTTKKARSLVDEELGEKKERGTSQLTRLGAKKATYWISELDQKFDDIDLGELEGEEGQKKLEELHQHVPGLIKKLQKLKKEVDKKIT